MNYLLLIIFGLAPSLIWLLYFLRRDVHPEDNREVIKIFLLGALMVLPTAIVQLGIFDALKPLKDSYLKTALTVFLGVALIEELSKYLVVKEKVLSSAHFDEPMDLPLYLIISSLGFAAIENIMVILNQGQTGAVLHGLFNLSLAKTALLSLFRFVSATFLHTLASGTLGVFLALSIYLPKDKIKLTIIGFFLAVSLHGLYNFSIMRVAGDMKFLLPFLIIINLAIVLSLGFGKLKKLKSVCQTNN